MPGSSRRLRAGSCPGRRSADRITNVIATGSAFNEPDMAVNQHPSAPHNLPAFTVDADEYDVRYVVTTASGGFTGLADTCPGVTVVHTDGYGAVLERTP